MWANFDGKPYTQDEWTAHVAAIPREQLAWCKFITLHNTSAPTLAQWVESGPAHDARIRNLENYYEQQLGWHAGPHAFISRHFINGFSNITRPGVHASCFNSVSIGLEMAGEFDIEDFNSGDGAMVADMAVHAMAVLHWHIGIRPDNYLYGVRGLHFHIECAHDNHSCPGRTARDKPALIARILAHMDQLGAPAVAVPTPPPAAPITQASADASPAVSNTVRHSMAKHILDFEARRDHNGHLMVYQLPSDDGGGSYEVAGINERFDGPMAAKLKAMVEAGQFDAAETEAENYILNNTNPAADWTTNAGVEFYLRDCLFNRGVKGAARILQHACGVSAAWHDNEDDGKIGPKTRGAMTGIFPVDLLTRLRAAREDYERVIVGYRANFWQGLVNRWDNALAIAKGYLAP